MFLNLKKPFAVLIRITLGCFALSTVSIALAANWPMAPCCSFQSGPIVGLDLDEAYQDKLSFEGIVVSQSVGCLWSSLNLDNWLISTESHYHGCWSPTCSSFKEHGGFLVTKLTFARAEGVESFLGLGLGSLYLIDVLAKNKPHVMAALVTTGLNWYLNKGGYLTLRSTWIKPVTNACARKQTFSFGLGLHWCLI